MSVCFYVCLWEDFDVTFCLSLNEVLWMGVQLNAFLPVWMTVSEHEFLSARFSISVSVLHCLCISHFLCLGASLSMFLWVHDCVCVWECGCVSLCLGLCALSGRLCLSEEVTVCLSVGLCVPKTEWLSVSVWPSEGLCVSECMTWAGGGPMYDCVSVCVPVSVSGFMAYSRPL